MKGDMLKWLLCIYCPLFRLLELKHDMPFQDTKHEIAYEEIDHIE